jgi:microcystin-dependent protein
MSDMFGGQESAAVEAASGSEKPLTDEERALLQRLLSDPFSLPQQFKTWLVAYLEGSDILLARSSIQGLGDLLGSGGGSGILGLLPAGCVFPYGGTDEPTGAKLCNGQLLSRTGFKRLFDAIGTIYGAGDGSTTFAVPDLRRRLLFGAGSGIGHGTSDGRAETSRHVNHKHWFGQTSNGGGGHSHGWSGSVGNAGNHDHGPGGGGGFAKASGSTAALGSGGTSRYLVTDYTSGTDTRGDHGHSVSGSVGGVGDHDHYVQGDTSGDYDYDRPAFLTVGFIINY